MKQQFIVIGKADEGTETELCLLTRRVFPSVLEAKTFIKKDRTASRNAQIVECYFPIPDSLYASDWKEVNSK